MKRIIPILVIGILVSGFVLLQPTALAKNSDKSNKVSVPPHAVKVAEDVYALGKAKDVDGKAIQGFMFIHPKKAPAKPEGTPGKGGNGSSKCYAFIANGAKWKVTEQYVLNPANGDGMNSQFVADTIATTLERWDSQVEFDIFGTRDMSKTVDGADTSSTDGKNEIFFADITDPGVIAATIVWYTIGPPQSRQIVEFDMIFEDPDFTWGDAGDTSETELGDTSIMDLENIAAHEDGHAAGMGHPDDSCSEETMYRFSQEGETKRRTLNAGDIDGIKALYN
jgi:hypothetical protein